MKAAAFLLGVAVGWLLVRRRQPRRWTVRAGNPVFTTPTTFFVERNAEPMPGDRYASMLADGYMHMGWMQADGGRS